MRAASCVEQTAECRRFLHRKCAVWVDDGVWNRANYRNCGRALHPDKPGGSSELMVELNACNEVLIAADKPGRDVQFMVRGPPIPKPRNTCWNLKIVHFSIPN